VTFRRSTPYLMALASGALQVVIFPSFRYYILAPLVLVPLLVALAAEPDRRKQLLLGTLAGCVFWGGTCYWIYDVMHRYAFLPAPAAAAIFVGFFAAKGLHSGLFALLAAPLLRRSWAIPGVAAAWVAVEGTHQYIFTWLHLGNAGISMATLARLAPWTGVYGLSFALAMMNVAVALVILRRPRRELAWLVVLPLLYLLPPVPPQEAGSETVRLIQPNIHPDELLEKSWTRRRASQHLARMKALSTEAGSEYEPEHDSLLIWPEYPVPAYYFDDPGFEVFMTELARKARAHVVFNTVSFQREGEKRYPLNSAVTWCHSASSSPGLFRSLSRRSHSRRAVSFLETRWPWRPSPIIGSGLSSVTNQPSPIAYGSSLPTEPTCSSTSPTTVGTAARLPAASICRSLACEPSKTPAGCSARPMTA
jgi:apolipoprotein N-acyltransferase